MKPHNYNQLIFDKGAKNICGEKTAFSTKLLGNLVSSLQKTEIRSMFITLYQY
jgi:hypothetical protein